VNFVLNNFGRETWIKHPQKHGKEKNQGSGIDNCRFLKESITENK